MSRANIGFVAFNRGLVSPKALARVDIDRTRLSASVMTNWLPKTQGAMRIRPGTKYLGSSYGDTGAEWIEFVAGTQDTALVELTHQKMRVWVPSSTANTWETPVGTSLDVPLARPKVDTTLTLSDTGWSNTSTGGVVATAAIDAIPVMTAATTSGVTITAQRENSVDNTTGQQRQGWRAADDDASSVWEDTGSETVSALPSYWWVDFGASNTKAITSYSIRAAQSFGEQAAAPGAWAFQRSDDANTWTSEDTQGSEASWAAGERRTFTVPGADTGTVEARRHWRFNFTASSSGSPQVVAAEIEMYTAASAQQVKLQSGAVTLNASSLASLARLPCGGAR